MKTFILGKIINDTEYGRTSMNESFNTGKGMRLATRVILLAASALFVTGCGVVTVRHVPKLSALSSAKMSDLRSSQPIDVKAGACSSEETSIGTVGMGKVVGKMSDWTDVTAGAVRANLSARGATLTAGSPKILTITMTKAQVSAIPIVGGATSKIALTATTPEGLNSAFEASNSAMAPLSAVDGAVADAIKKLLTDSAVESYLRK
jgi:hypothetical protein